MLVATAFGRTVAINGTGGTDHGTASCAMLIGGSVRGGRVIADWTGLGANALFENRDLKPTMRLDAFIAGAVAGYFGTDPVRTMMTLFPNTPGTPVVHGLLRA